MWKQNNNSYSRPTNSGQLHQVFRTIHKTKANLQQELKQLSQPHQGLTLPHLSTPLHARKQQMFPRSQEQQQEKIRWEEQNHHQKYKTVLTEQEEPSLALIFPASKLKGSKAVSQRLKSQQHTGRLPSTRKQPRTHALKTQPHRYQQKQFEGKTVDAVDQREQGKRQFLNCIGRVPSLVRLRSETVLEDPLRQLQLFNPFFNRTHPIVGLCLLKVGTIVHKRNTILYRLGHQASSLFLILSGKVRLSNGALRRICRTGETVLEEGLFQGRLHKLALQKGKVLGDAWLLELSLQVLSRVSGEMAVHGFRREWQEMEAVIKRNYIVKNWERNRVRAMQEV